MDKYQKLFNHILLRHGDANISFRALRNLMIKLGFTERVKGDHYIFSKDGVMEILNFQPGGDKAKSYQVKQLRNLILKYKIFPGEE